MREWLRELFRGLRGLAVEALVVFVALVLAAVAGLLALAVV